MQLMQQNGTTLNQLAEVATNGIDQKGPTPVLRDQGGPIMRKSIPTKSHGVFALGFSSS